MKIEKTKKKKKVGVGGYLHLIDDFFASHFVIRRWGVYVRGGRGGERRREQRQRDRCRAKKRRERQV